MFLVNPLVQCYNWAGLYPMIPGTTNQKQSKIMKSMDRIMKLDNIHPAPRCQCGSLGGCCHIYIYIYIHTYSHIVEMHLQIQFSQLSVHIGIVWEYQTIRSSQKLYLYVWLCIYIYIYTLIYTQCQTIATLRLDKAEAAYVRLSPLSNYEYLRIFGKQQPLHSTLFH